MYVLDLDGFGLHQEVNLDRTLRIFAGMGTFEIFNFAQRLKLTLVVNLQNCNLQITEGLAELLRSKKSIFVCTIRPFSLLSNI